MDQQEQFARSIRERYRMAPECPCGKSNRDGKFSPILGSDGRAGYCHSCAQFFTEEDSATTERREPEPELPPKIIAADVRRRSCNPAYYTRNGLFLWFSRFFTPEEVTAVFQQYRVGTNRKNETVFWTCDPTGAARQPRETAYTPEGKRAHDKTGLPPKRYQAAEGYRACAFGAHLLGERPKDPVAIVESEKNALAGALLHPEYIWLATLGASGWGKVTELREELTSREVTVFPDCDTPGRQLAQAVAAILTQANITNRVIDLAPTQSDGYDIADFLATQS